MSHGGSYGDEPWPSRSGASTWKRSASQSSASRRAWLPWLVTPCKKTTRGAPGSPHSLTSSLLTTTPPGAPRTAPPGRGTRPPYLHRSAVARTDAIRLGGETVPIRPHPAQRIRARSESLANFEDVQGLRHHLRPTCLVLHERPDHGALHVDEEGAAQRRAGLRVEDAVRLRGGAVLPEVRREDVLCAEFLLPCLTCCCRVAGDEDDLGPGVAERVEILLEVERFLGAYLRECERVENEEHVAAAEEVGHPPAFLVSLLEIELGRLVTRPYRHSPPLRRRSKGDSTGVPAAPRAGSRARSRPGRRAGRGSPRRDPGRGRRGGERPGASAVAEDSRAHARHAAPPRSRPPTRSTSAHVRDRRLPARG